LFGYGFRIFWVHHDLISGGSSLQGAIRLFFLNPICAERGAPNNRAQCRFARHGGRRDHRLTVGMDQGGNEPMANAGRRSEHRRSAVFFSGAENVHPKMKRRSAASIPFAVQLFAVGDAGIVRS
jgi:hypothetical protein